MNTGLDWENIKYFIYLAKEGRLQRAAKLLNSNHSTVYRRVKGFEESIQMQLFESTPSGYILTAAGEKLYHSVKDLEERMDEVDRKIHGLDNTLKGVVRITTTDSLATTILPRLLKKFKKTWPGICIELKVGNQHFNLSKREADIAIRPSSEAPPHLIGRNIGYLNFGVFASKDYLKNKPKENFLQNLGSYRFIGLDDSLSHLLSKKWLDSLGVDELQIDRSDNFTTVASLCSVGLGVAVLPLYMQGIYKNLEMIHRPKEKIGSDLWVLSHKDLSRNQKVRVTKNFFVEEIKKDLAPYL